MRADPGDSFVLRLNTLLDRELVKIVLSLLIIVSVLPHAVLPERIAAHVGFAFFWIFATEVIIRIAGLRAARRAGRPVGTSEVPLLLLDIVATLSFLPVHFVYPAARGLKVLRLVRLARMLLLLRYWGPVGREVAAILAKRRYQILFAASVVMIFTFVTGTLLANLDEMNTADGIPRAHDYNDDGRVDEADGRFVTMLWWAFRQMESTDNIAKDPRGTILFLFSLILTVAGVFVVSFVVGIGTSVVEELVDRSRGRPIGMRDHSAVMNIGRSSHLLLRALQSYYAKQIRKLRLAVLGDSDSRPDYLFPADLAAVRYRSGNPSDVQDLLKVDADKARRVVLLADADDPTSDARVISQILSVRQLNSRGAIVAEVINDEREGAAREAGGPNTAPVLTRRLTGLYLANLLLNPGIEEVYRELLTIEGHEIYTLLYGFKQVPPLKEVPAMTFGALADVAMERYGILLLGAIGRGGGPDGFRVVINPEPQASLAPDFNGFVALANRFEDLRRLGHDLAHDRLHRQEHQERHSRHNRHNRLSVGHDGGAVGGAAAVAAPPLAMSRCPQALGIRKILVCGFAPELVHFLEELFLFLDRVEVYLMLDREEQIESIGRMLVDRSRHPQRPASCGTFVATDRGIEFHERPGVPARATVRLCCGDASSELHLLDPTIGGFTLGEIDAALYMPQIGTPDPDAKTVLGLLTLAGLMRSRPDIVKRSLRVIAEVSDPERAALLRRHTLQAGQGCLTPTVLSREQLRHDFLAQAICVPGVGTIYDELLGERGEQLGRVLVDTQGQEGRIVRFPELVRTLRQRQRLIPVGVELRDRQSGQARIYLNPRPGKRGFEIDLAELTAIIAVGELTPFAARATSCVHCPGAAAVAATPCAVAAATTRSRVTSADR